MSFTYTTKITTTVNYGDLGISLDNGSSEVDIEYSFKRIINFEGTQITAEYSISVAGVESSDLYRLQFTYSGSGNPQDQAEDALKAYFDAQAAAAESTTEESEATS